MTEAEWLTEISSRAMLDELVEDASERKLRLFACHCCRLPDISKSLRAQNAIDFVDVVERFAERHIGWNIVESHFAVLPHPRISGGAWRSSKPAHLTHFSQALQALRSLGKLEAWDAAWGVVSDGVNLIGNTSSVFLRDIFGNPFRPVAFDPAWLTPTVLALANGIYTDRAFDRMPILADALEEAGCDNADVLLHCRGEGPHVKGCWVVDAVLGKE